MRRNIITPHMIKRIPTPKKYWLQISDESPELELELELELDFIAINRLPATELLSENAFLPAMILSTLGSDPG